MGKAVFKDTSKNGIEVSSETKLAKKMRIRKSHNSLKVNLILFLTLLNFILSIYGIFYHGN